MWTFNYAVNTLSLLLASVLVMCFVAGTALVSAGSVREKNSVDQLTKCIVLAAIGSLVFIFVGYGTMFSSFASANLYWPSFKFGEHDLLQLITTAQLPVLAHVFLLAQFAGIPLIIIASATAERFKPWVLWLFALLFAGLIYSVLGFWVWGGGFLEKLHFIDAAGSGVIHLAGAVAALIAVLLLGPRLGRFDKNKSSVMRGANLTLGVIGIWLVWLSSVGINVNSGWMFTNVTFFNSPLGLAGIMQTLAIAALNTQMSIVGSVLAAVIVLRIFSGTVDLTIILNAVVVGIVALAASAITPSMTGAFLIGAVGGILLVLAILLFEKFKIDDPVGAIAAHGVGGLWGLLAAVMSQDYVMLSSLHKEVWSWPQQLTAQLIGIGSIIVWVAVSSLILLLLFKYLVGIRISATVEYKGLDAVEYGGA